MTADTDAASVSGVFERGLRAGLAGPGFSFWCSTAGRTGLELPGARAGRQTGRSSSGTDGSSTYSGAECLLIGLFTVLSGEGEGVLLLATGLALALAAGELVLRLLAGAALFLLVSGSLADLICTWLTLLR